MTKSDKERSWEDRFDNEWQELHWGYNILGDNRERYTEDRKDEIKSFIKELLSSYKADLEKKVLEMKEKSFQRMGYTGEKTVRHQTIDDLLSLLRGEK